MVVASFVTAPVHFFAISGGLLENVLLFGSVAVFIVGLLLAVFRRPHDWMLPVYALVACVLHGIMSPSI